MYIIDNDKVMSEWDWEKNNELNLNPRTLKNGSSKKAHWICKSGHKWIAVISTRTKRNYNCPYCTGRNAIKGTNDFATLHPELLEEWNWEENNSLEIYPDSILSKSHKEVHWICKKGHNYKQTVNKRVSRQYACPYCSGQKVLVGFNDLKTTHPKIASEWHPNKNQNKLPEQFSYGSGAKIWWQCPAGHEYMATIHDRVGSETNCPICNKRRSSSFAEQAILFYIKKLYPNALNKYRDIFQSSMELDIFIPEISVGIEFDGAHWHKSDEVHQREIKKYNICKENNIFLIRVKEENQTSWKDTADFIYYIPKSKKTIYLEETIQAILDSLDKKSNMWTRTNPIQFHSPITVNIEKDKNEIYEYLSETENSLALKRPDLLSEWNFEKNGTLNPYMFHQHSNEKVWWKCSKCNHEWKSSINDISSKEKIICPRCSLENRGKEFTKSVIQKKGSLADNNPTLASEWSKKNTISPYEVAEKSNKKVLWKCKTCGFEWESTPNNRSKGVGCPYCSGRTAKKGLNDLETINPELAKEWNYNRNEDAIPSNYLPKSGKKVWWICSKCGYEWEAVIRNRSNGSKCPVCKKEKNTEDTIQ